MSVFVFYLLEVWKDVGIGTIGVLRCLGLVAVSTICLSLIWYWLRRFWLIVAEDNRCFFFYLKKFCWHCRQNHVFFFPAFSHYQRKNKSYKYIYIRTISSESPFQKQSFDSPMQITPRQPYITPYEFRPEQTSNTNKIIFLTGPSG